MSRKRILVVEDEADMAELVSMRLRREGYLVTVVHDGPNALQALRSEPPDLAIVDIMLPGIWGTDLVKEMRRDPRAAAVPVIMMTAKGEESDIVGGLGLGADDYVTKPFSMSVLVARVAAVLRRAAALREGIQGTLRVGRITIDPQRHVFAVDGQPVPLTLTESRLLTALAAARGKVLTRNQLIDQVMGLSTVVTDRTIDVHLASLRRKLGAARKAIQTVRGVGYRLAADERQNHGTT
jgi:two-component system phosphate regulon response regulator PhoB